MELIEIDSLFISKQNIRKNTSNQVGDNESSIDELAASIREHGLLNPISVRKVEKNKYDIFAGQIRFLAMNNLSGTNTMYSI